MSKKGSPSIDYNAAATAQGTANQQTALQQALLNNPNMITPYGNQTYTMGADGRPTLTQTLSPDEQNKLNLSNQAQMGALGILNSDMPNVANALSGPFGLPGGATSGDFSGIGQTRTDLGNTGNIQTSLNFGGAPGMPSNSPMAALQAQLAAYQQGAQYLDPQFQHAQSDLTSNLANQGIAQGTAAAERAQGDLNRQQQQAYGDLVDRSIATGNTENQAQFERGLQARQQGVGEATTQGEFANSAQAQQLQDALARFQANNSGVAQGANIQDMIATLANNARGQNYQEYATNRTMPLNMLNSLLSSSQVTNPTFQATTPTQITPAPILAGAQLAGQQNAANSSAGKGMLGSGIGALGTALGGGGLSSLLKLSDRRLKSKIRRIGTHRGLAWYSYIIGGRAEEGVMADEVLGRVPGAVIMAPDGFLRVDYGRL